MPDKILLRAQGPSHSHLNSYSFSVTHSKVHTRSVLLSHSPGLLLFQPGGWSFRGRKSKIRVPAWSCLVRAHFLFCRGCVPAAFSHGGGERVMPPLNLCFHQREFYLAPWFIGDFSWIHWSSVPKWISASCTLSFVKLLISSVMCCKLTWYNWDFIAKHSSPAEDEYRNSQEGTTYVILTYTFKCSRIKTMRNWSNEFFCCIFMKYLDEIFWNH